MKKLRKEDSGDYECQVAGIEQEESFQKDILGKVLNKKVEINIFDKKHAKNSRSHGNRPHRSRKPVNLPTTSDKTDKKDPKSVQKQKKPLPKAEFSLNGESRRTTPFESPSTMQNDGEASREKPRTSVRHSLDRLSQTSATSRRSRSRLKVGVTTSGGRVDLGSFLFVLSLQVFRSVL